MRCTCRIPNVPISVDTVKSGVARAALAHGADVINDVSGFRLDPAMADVCAERKAGVILMHSRGGVETMGTYADAVYGDDVVGEVIAELGARVEWAARGGGGARAHRDRSGCRLREAHASTRCW